MSYSDDSCSRGPVAATQSSGTTTWYPRKNASCDDVDVLGPGVQIVDHPRTPRSLHAVGCPLQPFAILAHVASVGIHDEQDGTAAPASRVDDPPLGRDEPLVAGQDHGATWLAELVQHVDDDNRARPCLDAHRLLDLSRREDVHCHGNPPAARVVSARSSHRRPSPFVASSLVSPPTRGCGRPPSVTAMTSTISFACGASGRRTSIAS